MTFREICKQVPGWNPRTVQANLHNLISCGVVSCNVDLRDARMLIYGVRKEVKE
jgi:hypothetical protein